MRADSEEPRHRRRIDAERDSEESMTQTGPAYVDLDRRELDRAHKIQEENWIRAYWRPAMGWLYMLICFVDFVFFPLLAMVMPAMLKSFGVEGATYVPWTSLTLSNGGMIHLAFGAILGVTAWTRGIEKLQPNRGNS
jgi:hypothetical protein